MARQRRVYVIEFKTRTGSKWFAFACNVSLNYARKELRACKQSNPNAHWRIVKYFPRFDEEG